MYQAKSGVNNFSLYWGGRGPSTKIFFPAWTCIKPNLVSKIFPFTGGGGGGSFDKNFCSGLNMYQAKSGVKNVPFTGGGPTKNFFLAWTCIKPNLVSKIFPFTGGGPLTKIFFPAWTCIKPNLVSKFFPFTGRGGPLTKFFFPSLNMYQAKSGVKNFSLYWDWVPPQKNLRPGTPPGNLRPVAPPEIWDLGLPLEIWDLGPPPEIWDLVPPPENLRPGTSPKNLRPGIPPWTDTHLWKHNLPS